MRPSINTKVQPPDHSMYPSLVQRLLGVAE